GAERDRARVLLREVIVRVVDQRDAVDGEERAVVAVDVERVGLGELRADRAAPAHREAARGDPRRRRLGEVHINDGVELLTLEREAVGGRELRRIRRVVEALEALADARARLAAAAGAGRAVAARQIGRAGERVAVAGLGRVALAGGRAAGGAGGERHAVARRGHAVAGRARRAGAAGARRVREHERVGRAGGVRAGALGVVLTRAARRRAHGSRRDEGLRRAGEAGAGAGGGVLARAGRAVADGAGGGGRIGRADRRRAVAALGRV